MIDEAKLRAIVRAAGAANPDALCRDAGIEPEALKAMVLGMTEDAGPVEGKLLIAFVAGVYVGADGVG